MKKTAVLFSLFIASVSCTAQTLPLNTYLDDIPNNAYVKDLDNELKAYTGVYEASFENKKITLYLTKQENKIEKSINKTYFMDALVVKYVVKNASDSVLQDTKNITSNNNQLYSIATRAAQNEVTLLYSGTNCSVGWGVVILKKLNANQLSWEYRPNDIILDDATCPPGIDLTIYLPETKDLIFTKAFDFGEVRTK
ncbi:hypothetical protein SAMN05660477_00100 [Soonwooa buanensis]|uniref:DUF6705 domain-containing protein n=1 Tax=Soonwooa buanensis TaxID=619805 RepID=A0A1T5CJ21_9FLAO|nr:DUF6705 family protein [Soonwooa buanensis]SKB59472.1 hypothetical protein SAMN05660477_00100 [Soonwooa buanensis]